MLQRDGFNRIAYSGDYMSTYANGGIGLTEEKIKTNPAGVLAFVKGTLKALQYSMKNRGEMIKIMPGYLGIKDPALNDQLYELYLTRQSVDGSVDEPWMLRRYRVYPKNCRRRSQGGPPSQVFDFSFVQKAAR